MIIKNIVLIQEAINFTNNIYSLKHVQLNCIQSCSTVYVSYILDNYTG